MGSELVLALNSHVFVSSLCVILGVIIFHLHSVKHFHMSVAKNVIVATSQFTSGPLQSISVTEVSINEILSTAHFCRDSVTYVFSFPISTLGILAK